MGKKVDGGGAKKTPVESRQFSCSELKNGEKALLEVIYLSLFSDSCSVRHVQKIRSRKPNKKVVFQWSIAFSSITHH